jgi:hypothetical protein
MGHRMVEPEFSFRVRMNSFVFRKDAMGLLEKTAKVSVPGTEWQKTRAVSGTAFHQSLPRPPDRFNLFGFFAPGVRRFGASAANCCSHIRHPLLSPLS